MSNEVNPNLPLEIGHVLFIDIVGYSKLLIDDQREAIHELKEIVRATKEFQAAESQGKLISLPTGDGMVLAFFTTPDVPVRCAVEVARALKNQPRMAVRMGVHSGPVSAVADVNERSNLAGAGINIAQRVMDCGDAGHILVSHRIAEDISQFREWSACLHDLGEAEVKHGVQQRIWNLCADDFGNGARPSKLKGSRPRLLARAGPRRTAVIAAIALLALVSIAAVLWRSGVVKQFTASARPIGDRSIAVLPFVDLSQAKDQEYFCDGISEELLDSLAKIEGLRVVARTSSFSFKGKTVDAGEIARKLGVQHLLEGSLRRDGNRIRITAQLINARDGFHLWSQSFERELQGVFAVQDEITRVIVEKLKVKLALAPPPIAPVNIEAHELYLRGLYFSNKSSEEDLRKALALFQQALDKDPTLGRAWTGVAKAWLWLADEYVKPLEGYSAVIAAANKALALNPNDTEARCLLGEAKWVLNWDLAGAEAEIERALALEPNSAVAHFFVSPLKAYRGDCPSAIAHIIAAERLDPLSVAITDYKVNVMLWCDQLDEALSAAQRTVELDPNFLYIDPPLARVYRAQGKLDEALAIHLKTAEMTQRPRAGLALTYADLGRKAEAREVLRQLLERRRSRYVRPETIAGIYAALGEREEAFTWLETAYTEHSANLPYVVFDAEFRPLRSDPRFAAILKRIGLDPTKVLVKLPEAQITVSPKSIAVLPFENLSDDKSNAYFADGIQDQILTKLAGVADLKVISRISTAKYKSKPENLKTVAQELGVATVLEGTVQRAGDRVRVNVQLIDARADTHLWAKNYDRELKDVFGVQSEVAQQIADALRAKLSPSEATALAVAPTRNPEAYDLFLQGEYEMRQGESALTSPEPFDRAARLYREALSRDPNFALAAARLAQGRLGRHWFVAPFTAAELEEVKNIVDRALALAPALAEAHVSLALFYYWGQREYDAALAEFQQALELQPNSVTARQFRAAVYRRQGQWERSLADHARAVELDPRDPKIPGEMAGTYVNLRQWSDARRAGLRALAIDPQQVVATQAVAFSYVHEDGDLEAAKRVLAGLPGNIRTNNRGGVATMIGFHAYLRVLERDFAGALKEAEKQSADSTAEVLTASVRTAICVLAGDGAGARLAGGEALALLEPKLREHPEDVGTMSQLSWVYVALGRNADALRLAHQTAASLPIEKDAYWGPIFEAGLAQIQARAGEPQEAIKTLRRLLAIPAGASVALQRLKIDPVWDPIRNDPGFQQLLAGEEHVGP